MTTVQDQIRRELEEKNTAFDQAQADQEQRARDVHSSRRSQLMEGGDISPFAQQLSQEYIDGKITPAEMREKLLKHHGVSVK